MRTELYIDVYDSVTLITRLMHVVGKSDYNSTTRISGCDSNNQLSANKTNILLSKRSQEKKTFSDGFAGVYCTKIYTVLTFLQV